MNSRSERFAIEAFGTTKKSTYERHFSPYNVFLGIP